MGRYWFYAASLVFVVSTASLAGLADWRLTATPPAISEADKTLIGRAVCGEGRFELTGTGVRCKVCPEFTSNANSDEGLEIGHRIRGRFTAAKAEGEWLLDTDGCEAHFTNFGGTLLLGPTVPRIVPGMPAVVLGASLAAKPAASPLGLIFYKPGFRVNDCLAFGGQDVRTLLVCNEADLAQGEVIGHISAMEISRRGITRWRLLRWYDNSGSDMPETVSVVPTGMRRVELDKGQAALQIKVKIIKADREVYEKVPDLPGKTVSLLFQRKGQRFFATEKTQKQLEEIGVLTRKMLD